MESWNPAEVKSDIDNRETKQPGSLIEMTRLALSEHYAGASIRIVGRISVRDNSEIFRTRIETIAALDAAIKCCFVPHTKTPDESAAREQFLALEKEDNALKKGLSRYRVPTPLYLAPELATLTMSWVEGESLTRRMRRPAIFIKGAAWFEVVGAWLGNFHTLGPMRHQKVNLAERLSVVERLSASPLPDKSFAEAIRILKITAPELEGIEAEMSWLHGDCKTDNFFLSGPDIYGIDISLSYENPVEYDLAQFFNNLDLLLASPQNLYLAGMKSTLKSAFWRGYRSTGPSVSRAYLNWLRLNFSLSSWHTMQTEEKPGIRNWMLNRMFSTLVNRLTGKITSSQ